MKKYVYAFSEGNKNMKDLLGGKGSNLAEMKFLGLPVPDGFIVTTEACNKYYEDDKKISPDIEKQIFKKLAELEKNTGKKMNDIDNPLLVSVRSGARVSMPGMMDTVLNLGLNDIVVENLANITNNKRFAYDSYRRFIMMFTDVVKGYDKSEFESVLSEYKKEKKVKYDTDLDAEDMIKITDKYKDIYKKLVGSSFPQDTKVQLIEAITAVFRSWNNERAISYRRINDISSDWGTAVNVQEMVYGNIGENSGTGVAFSRNPASGEDKFYGEYLINAQGEDVVAGIRTPQNIETLKEIMPKIYNQFYKIAKKLEKHYKDMQDMEFTIEKGKLYILQTRNGKRTANAAIKIAVDMVKEKLITKEEAILKVDSKSLDQLLHESFNKESLKEAIIISTGLAASPGAACGKIYFNAKDVIEAKNDDIKAILVRSETSPEDIEGMHNAEGILTVHGGMTSHAAVVARGMGKCCVCGCSDLIIDEHKKTLKIPSGKVYREGDYISIDGSTGIIYDGKVKTEDAKISGDFELFMNWVNSIKKIGVYANADNPTDAKTAIKFGAEGIGLCRTEHMFFDKNRILAVRQMILSNTTEEREKALKRILPMQRKDFEKIFTVLNGKSVTIRYLDPPLHEFLPKEENDIRELARELNITNTEVKNRINELKEFNPMMGHRGCRLAVSYPEIARMQTKAVIEAAINVREKGIVVKPEIMIPLVGDLKELIYVKNIIIDTSKEIFKAKNKKINYKIGTMIELPRAALLSYEIADEVDFFSFGTNDLTQMTYGLSRDDASKFLKDYYDKSIYDFDPFTKLDTTGVGQLIEFSAKYGRKANRDLKLGICGEHGADPSSIDFCYRNKLNYVSCSPYRVPIARLAAAQAAIKSGSQN